MRLHHTSTALGVFFDDFPACRVEKTFLLSKLCLPVESSRIRRRHVEFVLDGYLKQIHFGGDYYHVIGLNFHPVR